MRAACERLPHVRKWPTTSTVTAGDLSITLPAGVTAEAVVAVRNVAGTIVARADDRVAGSSPRQSPGATQGWSAWGGTLRLRRAAAGTDEIGAWSIDSLGGRELAGNDLDPQPVEAGDAAAIVALAAAMALERRAVESGKRGDTTAAREMRAIADAARNEAATLLAARRRRPRGGFLQVDGVG